MSILSENDFGGELAKRRTSIMPTDGTKESKNLVDLCNIEVSAIMICWSSKLVDRSREPSILPVRDWTSLGLNEIWIIPLCGLAEYPKQRDVHANSILERISVIAHALSYITKLIKHLN